MRLYIIRHAHPDYDNNTITDIGHREAAALGVRLERENITRLYTSPLGRAVDTAAYAADRLGIEAKVEPWAYELGQMRMMTGPCAGMMAWDLHGEILRNDPWFARSGQWHTVPPLDAPIFREEVERVRKELDDFTYRLGYRRDDGRYQIVQHNTDRVALVCHNGAGLTMLAHLLALPLPLFWSGFWLAPSSVSCLVFDERSERWATPRALYIGDTSHLYDADLPVQPHGIKANFE